MKRGTGNRAITIARLERGGPRVVNTALSGAVLATMNTKLPPGPPMTLGNNESEQRP